MSTQIDLFDAPAHPVASDVAAQIEFQNWLRSPVTRIMLQQLEKRQQEYLATAQNQASNNAQDLAIRSLLLKARGLAESIEILKTKPSIQS